jgi:hypothetical protein
MKILYLIMGVALVPFGITVIYVNQYLGRKQEELRRRGFKDVNLFWPYPLGPRPYIGPVFIIAGIFFLLFYFLK